MVDDEDSAFLNNGSSGLDLGSDDSGIDLSWCDSGIPVLKTVFNCKPKAFDKIFQTQNNRLVIFREDGERGRAFVTIDNQFCADETQALKDYIEQSLQAQPNINWSWTNDESGGTYDLNVRLKGDGRSPVRFETLLEFVKQYAGQDAQPVPAPEI